MKEINISISNTIGRRTINQDRACFDNEAYSPDNDSWEFFYTNKIQLDDTYHIAALADGVTGSFDGTKAAESVIKKIQNAYREDFFSKPCTKELLDELITAIISELRWELRASGRSSATTLSLVIFNASSIAAYNLGDSPIYLLRSGALIPLYVEHTVGESKL